jgi:subtilisin family serine protease
MSLGGPAMHPEVRELLQAFVTLKPRRFAFAAAGNDGAKTPVNYPGRWPEMQAIAAVDKDGNLTSFSSYEPDIVAVAAPGYQMLSTIPGGYGLMSGTSMACPVAAGVGAKILAKHANAGGHTPVDTPQEMREHLQKTAVQKGDLFLLNPMGMFSWQPPAPPLPPPQPVAPPWEKSFGIGSTKTYEYAVCRRKLTA